jgi:hypothetical protein
MGARLGGDSAAVTAGLAFPAPAHEYRLGTCSAQDWIVDPPQGARAKGDPNTVLGDPNRADTEEDIVGLIGQVASVSVATVKVVPSLRTLGNRQTGGNTQGDLDAAYVAVAGDPSVKCRATRSAGSLLNYKPVGAKRRA